MQTIRMNDGTAVSGHILPSNDGQYIFVYLDGKSLAEGYVLMSDTAKISVMTNVYAGEDQDTFSGYTEITAINTEYGNCNLTMRKV